jgi:hypothetical protein
VEARYKGRGTWHRATITRVRSGPVAAETHLAYKQKHELFTGVLFDLIYEDGASGALLLRDLRVRLRMGGVWLTCPVDRAASPCRAGANSVYRPHPLTTTPCLLHRCDGARRFAVGCADPRLLNCHWSALSL